MPGRCTRLPSVQLLGAGWSLQEGFDARAVSRELRGVAALRPGMQVGDDRRGGAQEDDAGAEWEGADAVGWQDRHPPYGALVRPGVFPIKWIAV